MINFYSVFPTNVKICRDMKYANFICTRLFKKFVGDTDQMNSVSDICDAVSEFLFETTLSTKCVCFYRLWFRLSLDIIQMELVLISSFTLGKQEFIFPSIRFNFYSISRMRYKSKKNIFKKKVCFIYFKTIGQYGTISEFRFWTKRKPSSLQ